MSEPPEPALPPETPVDAGSQALAEALRSSFAIVKVVMVLLVLVFLASGFFTVGRSSGRLFCALARPGAKGKRRCCCRGCTGRSPIRLTSTSKSRFAACRQSRSTIGWYAVTPEQELSGIEPPAGPPLNPIVDGYVLTADDNIIHSRATLTYRIRDPIRYVFSFVNASNAVQSALDNALLYAASRFKVDDMLTRDVAGFPGSGAAARDAVGGEAGTGHHASSNARSRAFRHGS